MINYFDDLINLLEAVVVIFSIPFAYIENTSKKLDKALNIIEKVGEIFLFRIANAFAISEFEINSVIKGELSREKLPSDTIGVNNICDYLVAKIESDPFITKYDRRRLIESIVKLKTYQPKRKIDQYRLISKNRKTIYITTLIFISLCVLILPEKWHIFSNLSFYISYIIWGSCIAFAFYLIFKIIRYMSTATKIDWGEPKLKASSFGFLPEYFDEKLIFRSGQNEFNFKLNNVELLSKKDIVETDPKFFSFGILKMYKILNYYILTFISEEDIEIKVTLYKDSVVNGFYDLDILEYSISRNEVSNKLTIVLNAGDFKNESFDYLMDFENIIEKHGLKSGYAGKSSDKLNLILDENKLLYGLIIDNKLFVKQFA